WDGRAARASRNVMVGSSRNCIESPCPSATRLMSRETAPMRTLLLAVFVFLSPLPAKADAPRTMRLDYFHTGNVSQELFALDKIVLEPLPWPGNPRQPRDELNLGKFFFEVTDRESKKGLYSRGFDSIYGEWVTTAEAKMANRTFHESLRFPAPDAPVQVTLKKRDANNAWRDVWSVPVDPKDPYIDRSGPDSPGPLIEIEKNG